MNPHAEYLRGLEYGLKCLFDQLDRDPSNVDLQNACDQLESKLAEAQDAHDRWESESSRRRAECELAYHTEMGTLDLY